MGCTACKEHAGEQVTVEYFDGTTETVKLCEDCRDSFLDAELVADLIRAESSGQLQAEE